MESLTLNFSYGKKTDNFKIHELRDLVHSAHLRVYDFFSNSNLISNIWISICSNKKYKTLLWSQVVSFCIEWSLPDRNTHLHRQTENIPTANICMHEHTRKTCFVLETKPVRQMTASTFCVRVYVCTWIYLHNALCKQFVFCSIFFNMYTNVVTDV